MSPTATRHSLGDQVQTDAHSAMQVLELGKDQVVSFAGTSQFTAQGVSACGLAAFNFARIGVRIEQSRKSMVDVLNALSSRDVVEEIVAICAGWSSSVHLEVEEIHELPIFARYLRLESIEYGHPKPTYFRGLLENMSKIEKSAVMVITRPPEIIACFKFAGSKSGHDSRRTAGAVCGPVFVVFDSHPRPSHPHGAALSFSTSIDNTVRTLSGILHIPDEGMYNSSDYEWQAQLLANCSAHMYVARHRRKDHEEAITQSSLAILTLRARISELKRENEELSSDNVDLASEVNRLKTAVQQEQKARQETFSSSTKVPNRASGRSFGVYSHAVAGPSRTSGAYSDTASTVPVRGPLPVLAPRVPDTGARSIFAHNPPPAPSRSPPTHNDLGPEDMFGDDSDDIWIPTTQFKTPRQLQDEFDSEDRRIRQEHANLVQYVQVTFQCSICMDELPEDDVAKVEGCMHSICRTCLREFVVSKIQEHRYPIFCPMCTVVAEGKARPGVVSRLLIEQLGISEEQAQVLTEMELAEYTVEVHCRKCRRSAFVDREDHGDAINIVCPQVDCNHVWCKKCEQTIAMDGPKHSCDGSSELDCLMKEKGWKHCPNCTTPILKESGCNHMTCISPGCNTHFCYICGGMIVRSALNGDINQAVTAHFRRCQLFEVPA